MLSLIVSGSLWLLGVHASAEYFNTRDSGGCAAEGGEQISSENECRVTAKSALGYRYYTFSLNTSEYPPGCSSVNGDVFYNRATGGLNCGGTVMKGGSPHVAICLCKRGGGGGGGSGDGDGGAIEKDCTDVKKRAACKALSQCNYYKYAPTNTCTPHTPGLKIPIKQFCEAQNRRKKCKQTPECMWVGDQCLLKSEAACGDIMKRRICQPLRSKNGGCLNGNHCLWTGSKCITTVGLFC